MNPVMHCRISRRRWGGQEEDYYPIHDLLDSTKELCSDSRHRVLHTHWGVKNIVIPIFGHTIINSDGKEIDVKDMCERDHLLVDYGNQFIPTLGDFVNAFEEVEIPNLGKQIETFHAEFVQESKIGELMLSPLAVTGQLKSLLLTHNSWFINQIVPQIFGIKPVIKNFSLQPSLFFSALKFESWMDNGLTYPASAENLRKLQVN